MQRNQLEAVSCCAEKQTEGNRNAAITAAQQANNYPSNSNFSQSRPIHFWTMIGLTRKEEFKKILHEQKANAFLLASENVG